MKHFHLFLFIVILGYSCSGGEEENCVICTHPDIGEREECEVPGAEYTDINGDPITFEELIQNVYIAEGYTCE